MNPLNPADSLAHPAVPTQAASLSRHPDAVAGVLCGLVAGAAYLLAQMLFVAAVGGSIWEPLQRIAAMLLGPNAAPPPADMSNTIAGIGLLVHFGLAIVYGRATEWLVRGSAAVPAAIKGAALGGGLYLLNFWLIAPTSFAWFAGSPVLVTLVDHLLFGAVAGFSCQQIRRLRAHRVAPAPGA